MTAREAEGEERASLVDWVGRDPSYEIYRQRTTRRIPVVVLDPTPDR